ncbi:Histone chaperone [Exophiala dermatitidis]
MSDSNVIDRAFAQDKQLGKRVFDAMQTSPQHAPLFEDIARYHLTHTSNGTGDATDNDNEPASKKRKLVNGCSVSTSQPPSTTLPKQNRQVLLEARDISFSIPQRKKLHLGIAQYTGGEDKNKSATGNTTSSTYALFTRNPATSSIEFEVDLNQFAYALRLPVPEKATKQYNFCLLPRSTTNSASTNANTSSTSPVEPIIWTVNHGPLKSLQISDPKLTKIISDSHCEPDQIFSTALNHILQTATRGGNQVSLTYPTETEFASAKPESHRKNDKAYHVKAFRGSKDGFLFFLENGIFFGFKKPLAFFAFDDIVSISYTSVLQRTFNLNVAYGPSSSGEAATTIPNGDEDVQEIEFSMLDQADFPGIDAYVKRHGLQDASLAESRRAAAAAAKKAAGGGVAGSTGGGVNTATSGVDDDGEEDGEDTRTELEKAQQQLEDEEDELEEDYDPGSEGESDGSGGSSESDDDDDNDDGHDQRASGRKKKANNHSGQNRDLVAEELGSEAEDVSITEDEVEEQEGHEDNEADPDGGEQHAAEEEEYDEDEDEVEDEHYDDHKNTWAHEAGMPDPDDEDQL